MTLVDSNVLFDILIRTPDWWQWSLDQVEQAALRGPILINDIVYAEVSTRYPSVDIVDTVLRDFGIDLV
ncbi:MAG TPA: DNA-binding protein, partial [Bradyrhizobium sp.]|nr:DNA-binding protein [Bradyrhizobium sp.]